MIIWELVCSPKEYGGLGVIDFKLAGLALWMRWLKRRSEDRAWSDLQIPVEKEVHQSWLG